ncbi:hypothetical protein [Corynebacterium tuberculostearicum]|nr:hypothetical protein [Corynebacterium tuberculostearicum]MDV2433053.1 hypothetical protein [Corynebacterium tuberculostearicum]
MVQDKEKNQEKLVSGCGQLIASAVDNSLLPLCGHVSRRGRA